MRPARPIVAVAVTVLALALTGCAAADGVPPTADDAPVSDGSDAASDGAAGTAPRAYTLEEAQAAAVDGPILVTGLLIDAGDGWRLCSAIAESYPPQCGGVSVTVEGLDPADHDLQEASGVRWSEGATLYGELDSDTFTSTGPASAA